MSKLHEVYWRGSFDHSGYGSWGKKLVMSLMDTGKYLVKVRNITKKVLPQTHLLYRLQFVNINNPIIVYNTIPMRSITTTYPHGFCTAFEINKPPEYMIHSLEHTDFVLALSTFSQKVIQSVVSNPEKVFPVNFPYYPKEFSPEGNQVSFKNINDDVFKFLVVARIDIRKNLDTLIKAFTEEFGGNDKVALLMKIYSDVWNPKLYINQFNPSDNIYWLEHRFEKMDALYRSVDAYVVTDFGEGWGGPCTEAMLSGIPTIAPRHSGHLDYMHDDNSWLIEVGNWEYIGHSKENRHPTLLAPYRKVKYPKFESIKKTMRTVYEEFKEKSRKEVLSHSKIHNALRVQDIVHPKKIANQLDTCFQWVRKNVVKSH